MVQLNDWCDAADNQQELSLATAWRLVSDGQTVLIYCPERLSVEPFAKVTLGGGAKSRRAGEFVQSESGDASPSTGHSGRARGIKKVRIDPVCRRNHRAVPPAQVALYARAAGNTR